ncbi:hypothetical protein POVWA2_051660 [Plasmodium ovale wallikeri]|uniref:Uncharacterized protein n=1 Tax=Plasmodium ovale wallikeri TaxID=864142 RepID=A0A1A8ZPE0_PLAOA|nr:hypothetical protein POVWA1_052390 [Plasmodium ovale wallikeri]SBT46251.1 hypothetical protein POVWA2_051660 [Plasmodium ovale wallikeri]
MLKEFESLRPPVYHKTSVTDHDSLQRGHVQVIMNHAPPQAGNRAGLVVADVWCEDCGRGTQVSYNLTNIVCALCYYFTVPCASPCCSNEPGRQRGMGPFGGPYFFFFTLHKKKKKNFTLNIRKPE